MGEYCGCRRPITPREPKCLKTLFLEEKSKRKERVRRDSAKNKGRETGKEKGKQ